MKSKIVTFLFILAAAILAGIFFATKKLVVNNDKSLTRAKIVNPKSVSSNYNKKRFWIFCSIICNRNRQIWNFCTALFRRNTYKYPYNRYKQRWLWWWSNHCSKIFFTESLGCCSSYGFWFWILWKTWSYRNSVYTYQDFLIHGNGCNRRAS